MLSSVHLLLFFTYKSFPLLHFIVNTQMFSRALVRNQSRTDSLTVRLFGIRKFSISVLALGSGGLQPVPHVVTMKGADTQITDNEKLTRYAVLVLTRLVMQY
jgi:hypothetical protein